MSGTNFQSYITPGGNVEVHYPAVHTIPHDELKDYCPFPGGQFKVRLKDISGNGASTATFDPDGFGDSWDSDAKEALRNLKLEWNSNTRAIADTSSKPKLPSDWIMDEVHVSLTKDNTIAQTLIVWKKDGDDQSTYVTAYRWIN